MVNLVYRYLGFWVGFQLGPSEKGLYIAFDSSENLQKGPLSTQIPLPRSMVEHGRIFTTSRGSVMKAMIRIGSPHSVQIRGSVS